MSTDAGLFFGACAVAVLSFAVTVLVLWHDIKKEQQKELNQVNAEYKQLVEDERRKRGA